MRENGEQAQTWDCCSLCCLIPCSFFDCILICPRLASLEPVCPKALSKVDIRQWVPLSYGTRIHPLSFLYLIKEGRGQSVNKIKGCTMKKSPEQKTVKGFSVYALQRERIWGSSYFVLVYQTICLKSSNLLIVIAKEVIKEIDQLNSHITSILKEFKVEIEE